MSDAAENEETSHVKVKVGADGFGDVIVDGNLLPNVLSVHVQCIAGETPKVAVVLGGAGVEVEVEGDLALTFDGEGEEAVVA